jgi:VWFA-related protein
MFFMALAFILLLANVALAQQPDSGNPTFHAGVALVKVDVQVVGRGGRVVPGLTKSDFAVFDDGRPQSIAYFGHENEPLDLVLLLDVSGSMHRHLQQLGETARLALKQLYPSDRVAVMFFARRTQIREPLTKDLAAVEAELREVKHVESLGSGTAINASLVQAAQYLQQEPVRGRRAVLIVTDNLSLNYLVPDDEVIRQLYTADAVLNGLLIGKQNRPQPPKPGHYLNPDFTPSDIFKLADQTGGEAIEGGRIGESFHNMVERIRARYSLLYAAPPSAAGAFHRIHVELAPQTRSRHADVVTRARAGYYAAQ